MTPEELMRQVLIGRCPRVFPDVAPFDTVRPYIVYQQVGGPALVYVEGSMPNKVGATMQISVWDESRLGANALMRSIEADMCASVLFDAQPVGALQALHDADTDRRGASQDFEVWFPRPP